jgi:hypothetical protein
MKGVALILLLPDMQVGSKNEKKEPITPSLKALSKDYIFHVGVFYWFILHFSHNFFNSISI